MKRARAIKIGPWRLSLEETSETLHRLARRGRVRLGAKHIEITHEHATWVLDQTQILKLRAWVEMALAEKRGKRG